MAEAGISGPRATRRVVIGYVATITVALGALGWIRHVGATLVAPFANSVGTSGVRDAPGHANLLPHLLLALVVVVAASRVLGALLGRMHQPPVVGEMLSGILLGPSLLGRLAPRTWAWILPPKVVPQLEVVAQIGVILFMFLVGLELDIATLRRQSRTSVFISHASIVTPFVLGATLALWLYPRFSDRSVPFAWFALFLGVSMSVTAFPVLARILVDRGLQQSPIGVIALTCAAIDDVTAWCLLAFIVGVVRARPGSQLVTLVGAIAYVVLMLSLVRPVVGRLARAQEARGRMSQPAIAAVFIGLLGSALATEALGIHAFFGAFLFGLVIPHDAAAARELAEKLHDVVVVLLLPTFFAVTGLRTQIGLVAGMAQWSVCGVIVLVACAGKFGGTFSAARLTGLGWHDAASLGVLMNTRGLMELVVLNLGLDLHLLSPTLFAMLVIMAIGTTILTAPVLQVLDRFAVGTTTARAPGTSRTSTPP